MDDERGRIVRDNRGAVKRADKPATDRMALALFGDIPPAIEFRAQPPADTVYAREKPFVPKYGPESFSSTAGHAALRTYLVASLGTAPSPSPSPSPSPAPSPAAPSAPGPAVVATTPAAPSPTPSRRAEATPSTPTPRPASEVTFSIHRRQQPQRAFGPSLLDQAAALESRVAPSTPRPSPQPRPGATIVRRPAPSLFIERKKPKKPAQQPGNPRGPPGGNGPSQG